MNIAINYCGTHSLIGAVSHQIHELGTMPESIIFDVDIVMQSTDIEKELRKAQKAFSSRDIKMSLGIIGRDLHKEELLRNPDAACYS